jgi:hypothetical protein
MKKTIRKKYTVSPLKRVVAIAMMLLLVWITGINFLYLSKDRHPTQVTCTDTDDDDSNTNCNTNRNPAGPDEKSPDAPITLSEEFIHEYHNPVAPHWTSLFFQHKVHEAEKLCIFHPELFSPPPEV